MQPNRDITKLAEPFKSNVKRWLDECNSSKLEIFVTEARRSYERQCELFGYGRTALELIAAKLDPKFAVPYKSKVTWTLESKHIDGQAVDIGFKGEELYPTDFSKWRQVADIAKKHNINWGWDMWRCDKPHFEWNGSGIYEETEQFINYKNMIDDKQKQAIEICIYACKNTHNFGNPSMQELAAKQAKEWRELLAKADERK